MALVEFQEGIGTGGARKVIIRRKITRTAKDFIDKLEIDTEPNHGAIEGDEIKLYDKNNNYLSGGILKSIKDTNYFKTLVVRDYSTELIETLVNNVYRNMSPEAIIEDIIDNETSLTFNSTVSSGIIIPKIVFNQEYAKDVIMKLLEYFKGSFRTDKNKNFYLEIKQQTTSTQALVNGVDINTSGWKVNTDRQVNKVIVIGALVFSNTTDQLSGTGTEFFLTYKPRDLRITVAGVEKIQTVEGQIAGDYTVDVEAKKITFNSSVTDPFAVYSYQTQIVVEVGDGLPQKKISRNYIETSNEAERIGEEYLAAFSDGVLVSTWKPLNQNFEDFVPNNSLRVIDNLSLPNIDNFFVINKVVSNYPGFLEIEVGEREPDIFDWQKETQERIKELEKRDQNSDFVRKSVFIQQGLKITQNIIFDQYQQRQIPADAMYYDAGRNYDDGKYYDKGDDAGGWQDIT